MFFRDKTVVHLALFKSRIYRILSAIGLLCLLYGQGLSQEPGAYRTILSGDFQTTSIWEQYDGTVWNAATEPPDQTNDVYINQNHTLSLSQDEEVKSLFINAEAEAGQKLNLNGFNLDIYGSLQAFEGPAPGTPNRAWNSTNWIGNSLTSTLTFRGDSRIIIPRDAWSAQSDNSRYSVVFDPGPGVELTIQEAFKSLRFTIRSGTLIQELDTSVNPENCPTFSFNTNTSQFGGGPYGDLIIEDGATLITNCNEEISFRSGSISAANFDLQQGGTLILEGENPQVEAATVQLNGTVIHRGPNSPKNFLSKSYADASTPQSVRNLVLEGNENLSLPNNLTILGNLTQSGTGEIIAQFSHLQFLGGSDQLIENSSLETQELTLNKPSGELIVEEDLRVLETLNMLSGSLNLNGNELHLNETGGGELNYLGGSWKNASLYTYHNIPTSFDAVNGTFPFEDTKNGGIRKVQLLGNSAGGDLNIEFTEYEGAEYNADFDDSDDTPILYRLYSYFQFSGLNPSTNPVELRISADKLIVDDVDDLRIVGTGYAAPGDHLDGLDPDELWARRDLTFEDLEGVNFTIGSFRTLSILPITWVDFSVQESKEGALLEWEVAQNGNSGIYEIYHSLSSDISSERKIAEVPSNPGEGTFNYQYFDPAINLQLDHYYRIKFIEKNKEDKWSWVIRLEPTAYSSDQQFSLFPNPYSNGKLDVLIPKNWALENIQVEILKLPGKQVYQGIWDENKIVKQLTHGSPGLYIIQVTHQSESQVVRWIRH
ncbi:T9SS type A sorting domain-containing protein [Algoriphagus hitonicola]|uniref:Por secretion system C-terminal sorting domain-containing protein n=1 Tax=Algoriphagus hitonicola TaxID=435880 RepID=A0A1I2RY33_9BACT|nr:T9SS type A sorting domain-containing protein [Algoriphagus hitonicola]SFG45534.1 Por secretion system C-terminal sorting domain-containing protein [Algoriphagus hitonicola]